MVLPFLLSAVLATNLPTVVVEATRIDAAKFATPAGVRVLDRREIQSANARDAVDLLTKRVPELHVRHLGGGNPALAELSLRGYGENGFGRTLVLMDGERLNSPDLNAPNLARIALGAVDRIEILQGPQCVLQGDGASAGVLNIITEPQTYERKTTAEFHGGSWGSLGGAVGTRGGFEDEGVRYWADGSWDRSDGYRSHSGYEIWNLNAGVRKDWANGTYLRFSGFYSDARYDLPGPLSYDEWKANPRSAHAADDNFRRATYGFNLTFNARLNDENTLRTTVNFSERKMTAYQAYAGGYAFDNASDIYATRVREEWVNETALFGFDNEFHLGAEYAYETLEGHPDYGYGADVNDYNRQLMDFFAQDTFHLTDLLALQLGGRYSRLWAFNNQASPNKKQNHTGAADVALVANPVEESKLYVRASRLYRAPFLDEIPYDPRTFAPMGLLDPETGWNAEAGFDWTFLGEFTVGGDAYFTWLEDEIFYDAVQGSNVNSPDGTYRRGFDLHAAWERDKFAALSLAFNYVRATFDGGTFGRNLIPLVPETALAVNGRVWLWDACSVFGGYRFQGDMVSVSDFTNDGAPLGWYGLFHVGVAYEPDFAEWARGFRLAVTVDNLFDERYCDYSTYGVNYYPAAGRSFTVSLRYEF